MDAALRKKWRDGSLTIRDLERAGVKLSLGRLTIYRPDPDPDPAYPWDLWADPDHTADVCRMLHIDEAAIRLMDVRADNLSAAIHCEFTGFAGHNARFIEQAVNRGDNR